jgi:ArsR family transcriptional regulator, virulence genes transcriptional regulator
MSKTFSDKPQGFIEQSAFFLDALANASRLTVLQILAEGEISVGSLSQKVGLSQSALSQHLARLRAAGLVRTRRDAQTIYYSCTSKAVHMILIVLGGFFEGEATVKITALL